MAEYHVRYGYLSSEIYAGTIYKNDIWLNKSICTVEAIEAVRDYMVENCAGGVENPKEKWEGYEWTLKDGRLVKLVIKIEKKNEVK